MSEFGMSSVRLKAAEKSWKKCRAGSKKFESGSGSRMFPSFKVWEKVMNGKKCECYRCTGTSRKRRSPFFK